MNRNIQWLVHTGDPDGVPGPYIPTIGNATSASDLFRVAAIHRTGHEGWNSCYADVATCVGLARLIEGEEIAGARRHFNYKERCIFCDIIAQERGSAERVVLENDSFIALCPYAPRFPFETWILPKYHSSNFEMDANGHFGLAADILKQVLMRIKIALDSPPYNFALHSAPFQGDHGAYFHWHIEVMPKITKMAGFEQGTGFYINPVPPEEAAEILRSVPIPPEE